MDHSKMESLVLYYLAFSLFVPSTLVLSTNQSKIQETKLMADLFGPNYDPRSRPAPDPTQPVRVNFRLALNQIYQVNEREQTVSIGSETHQMWRDPSISWNSSDYGGLKSFSVFYTTIWTPDTTLYNTADMYRQNVEDRGNARVISDNNTANQGALIQLIYNTHFTIICRFNMAYFPFDIQNCTFVFGSWTYDESQIHYNLEYDKATTELFYESQEWDLISFHIKSISVKYLCCDEPYQTIYAHLVIRRKSLFYIFNLVFPTIIINFMGSVALFASHGNEHNRHDKLQIGITTLLSYCILLLSVSDQIPHASSSIPLISWFFFCVMMQNALKMYVAIYLSYPDRRRYIRKKWENFKDKTCRFKCILGNKIGTVGTTMTKVTTLNRIEDEDDMGEECICLWVSLMGLVLITVGMFAVAYSQQGIWDPAV